MEDLSIHPRNWPRKCHLIGPDRAKKNTSKTPKPGRKRMRKLLAKIDARATAYDSSPREFQAANKRPGSRKMSQ